MLTLRNIDAGYGDIPVLRDVEITVPDNAVVALLGPNGAGKSTTMKVAAGALHPTAGKIGLDGVDITAEADYRRARRGLRYVPEGRSIFPGMTVRENLLLFDEAGEGDTALEKAAAVFPVLGQRRDQLAGSLSGGEQQMLALARCHIARARTIIVDEVSLGLAPKVVDEIYAFMSDIARNGVSLLIVEQYVDRALDLADYVYLMDRGRISFAGEPREISAEAIYESYVGVASGRGG